MSQFSQKNSNDAQKWAEQRKQQIEKAKKIKEERKQQLYDAQQNSDNLDQQKQSQQQKQSDNNALSNRPPTREELQQAQSSLQLLKRKLSLKRKNSQTENNNYNDEENDNYNQQYQYQNDENFNSSNNIIISQKNKNQQLKQSYEQIIEKDKYQSAGPYDQKTKIKQQAEEFMEINNQRSQSSKNQQYPNNIQKQNNPMLNKNNNNINDNNTNYRKVFKPPQQLNESDLDEQIRSINLDLGAINQTVKNVEQKIEQKMASNKYANQMKNYFQQESYKDEETNENSYTNSRTSYDSQDKKGFNQKNILTTTASPSIYQKPPKMPPNGINNSKQLQNQIQKYENTIDKLTSSRKNSLEKFNENQNQLIYNKGINFNDEENFQSAGYNSSKSKQVYQNNINKQSSSQNLNKSNNQQDQQNYSKKNSQENQYKNNQQSNNIQKPKTQKQQPINKLSQNISDEYQQQYQDEKKNNMQKQPPNKQNFKQLSNEDEYPDENEVLYQCKAGCGRKFKKEALEKHMKVCKKVFQEKRKVFDMKEQRIINDEHQQILQQNSNQPTYPSSINKKASSQKIQKKGNNKQGNKWNKQSEAFRAMLQQARGVQISSKQQQAIQIASDEQNSMVHCDYCGRNFNDKAAEKHIPFCKNKQQLDAIKKGGKAAPLGKKNSFNKKY